MGHFVQSTWGVCLAICALSLACERCSRCFWLVNLPSQDLQAGMAAQEICGLYVLPKHDMPRFLRSEELSTMSPGLARLSCVCVHKTIK